MIQPKMSAMKRAKLDKMGTHSIKKLLIEIGSSIIPFTLVFKALGFKGVAGLNWGILAGLSLRWQLNWATMWKELVGPSFLSSGKRI